MSTSLGLQSLIGLGVLALITCACSPDPSGTDEAADSGSDTSSEGTSDTNTSTLTDSGTDDGSPCDDEALATCLDAASEAYTACAASCPEALLSCVEADCSASCELERASAESTCQATHCSEPPVETCEQGCWLEFSSCLAAAECDVHECQWDAGSCLPDCVGCTIEVQLDFVFDGSCELALPELVHPVLLPYFSIELAGQTFDVADEGTPCDAPELGGTVESPLQGDVLLLCPTACDAFTDAGSLRVVVDGPCGA